MRIADAPDSSSTYELVGGELFVDTLTNNDTFDYSGGELHVTAIQNQGVFDFSGIDTRVIDGVFTNDGTVRVTDTSVHFDAMFTNSGAYISSPSDNRFVDLAITEDGYIQGGVGDRFIVSGDLLNNGAMSALWDTRSSELIFEGGDGTHTFEVTGEDRGFDEAAGYSANFEWGAIELAAGEMLILDDGNMTVGGGLYVEVLRLLGGVAQVGSITSNGINLYYDNSNVENGYLSGQTYSLSGGGVLAPVPEPGVGLLHGVAIIVLALMRRASRDQQT